MAHTDSPWGQLTGVLPATTDAPDVRADFVLLVTALEKKLNMSFATRGARDALITVPVDGMKTYIQDVGEIDERINSVWVKVYPKFYNGTTVPATTLGVVGDFYVQTA